MPARLIPRAPRPVTEIGSRPCALAGLRSPKRKKGETQVTPPLVGNGTSSRSSFSRVDPRREPPEPRSNSLALPHGGYRRSKNGREPNPRFSSPQYPAAPRLPIPYEGKSRRAPSSFQTAKNGKKGKRWGGGARTETKRIKWVFLARKTHSPVPVPLPQLNQASSLEASHTPNRVRGDSTWLSGDAVPSSSRCHLLLPLLLLLLLLLFSRCFQRAYRYRCFLRRRACCPSSP